MKNRRIKLNLEERISHYFGILIFLLPCAIYLWRYIDLVFSHTKKPTITFIEIAGLILAILFAVIQWNRLKFKKYILVSSDKSFQNAVDETAKQLDWTVLEARNDFIKAKANWSFASWGELITIVRTDDTILINSVQNPNNFLPALTSFGRNKKNIKTFIDNLESGIIK